MTGPEASEAAPTLLEREAELAALDDALTDTEERGDGRLVLIEGPPGIGKTALLAALRERAAARGRRVLGAVGSQMERDFGFGIVRRIFDPALRRLDPAARQLLFTGPIALTAAIFGLGEPGQMDVTPTEASLYGLFWLLLTLVEGGPMVIAIDDAHWADLPSLRFLHYLAHRLEGLPVVLAVASRPNEPGGQGEILAALGGSLAVEPIRPPLLSVAATARIAEERFGDPPSPDLAGALHDSSGGNPLLIESLVAKLARRHEDGTPVAPVPAEVTEVGAERIGVGVIERAAGFDPHGPAVVEAIAVIGDGAELRALASLAQVERDRAASILDGLVAAGILEPGGERRFAHPLLRTSVYESIAATTRAEKHARAARTLFENGAAAEAVAAHLLLSESGDFPEALGVLRAAAESAAERGAPESVVTYLRRALPEANDRVLRGEILFRLGRAEVELRDPAAVDHLLEAARLTDDRSRALDIQIELADVLALAGRWDAAVGLIETTLRQFEGSDLPGLLDLEAIRAAARGYDPQAAALFSADLPRLGELVRGRQDDRSRHLRWILAGLGACRDLPREEVVALVGSEPTGWSFEQHGRESSMTAQATLGLLLVDALEEMEIVIAGFEEDARHRGSLMAVVGTLGYRSAYEARRGRLVAAEENLQTALDRVRDSELGLMMLITFLFYSLDTVLERRGLDATAGLIEGLELPEPFGRTASGAMVLEVRGSVRFARGDRAGAVEAFRAVEGLLRPLDFSPRYSIWRSRLALALPEEERAEALALAEEELLLSEALGSPRVQGISTRTLGVLRGGEQGLALLRRSVELEREANSPLELSRSLTELGAVLRRRNQRRDARERLLEASDLAQRCGAERLEERIAEELRVAGAKPRRRAVSGPDSLTPSERRVAVAAAEGASNREICQMFFISLRTVEMHLTNAYRKLGISTRTDLAVALENSD